jgi:hypothetical protein
MRSSRTWLTGGLRRFERLAGETLPRQVIPVLEAFLRNSSLSRGQPYPSLSPERDPDEMGEWVRFRCVIPAVGREGVGRGKAVPAAGDNGQENGEFHAHPQP